jgi:hypothetical protein
MMVWAATVASRMQLQSFSHTVGVRFQDPISAGALCSIVGAKLLSDPRPDPAASV